MTDFSTTIFMSNLALGLPAVPEPQRLDFSLLVRAASGTPAQVRRSLAVGAALEARDADGATALLRAVAINRDPAVAYLLIEHGANPAAANDLGQSMLHLAAARARPALVRRALERGAGADTRTTNGTTALMLAARSGCAESVLLLLEAGADPAAHNDAGRGVGAFVVRDPDVLSAYGAWRARCAMAQVAGTARAPSLPLDLASRTYRDCVDCDPSVPCWFADVCSYRAAIARPGAICHPARRACVRTA